MAELDGPRLAPQSGPARQLIVFVHGYGADGNDLIEIGRAWAELLPQAAFVSPHAPRPCGQAPMGREWFSLTFRSETERWDGCNMAASGLDRLTKRPPLLVPPRTRRTPAARAHARVPAPPHQPRAAAAQNCGDRH